MYPSRWRTFCDFFVLGTCFGILNESRVVKAHKPPGANTLMSGLSQLPKIDIVHRAIASGPAKPKWWPVLVHSSRAAVAAVASVLAARLFRLPETYWAPITTLVITQSSLGTAVTVSGERFMGTALGAAVGAIVASHFGPGMLVFGISVFILGILSAAVHSDRSAYRLAGVTLAIVLLVPRTGPASQIALHRFSEVCIGIGVALVSTVVRPE